MKQCHKTWQLVSTNARGIQQIIEDGVNGLRVEAGNVRAFAGLLIKLLNDEEVKKQIGINGRARIEKGLNVKRSVDAIVSIYKEIEKQNDGN